MTELVPGEPLIAFKDVRIAFDEHEVLRGVSFDVWPGDTKVFLGESGSGKTLIMKMAIGLIRPDAGRIWVMGHEIGQMHEKELLDFRRNIGFVFQEGALFDSMTVSENVAFRLREENVPEAEIETRVREVLRFVEMEPAIEKFPPELSGGMRRRVSIARALVDRPQVVFYDSPTAGLDPVTSQTIITLILRGRDLQGVTSLARHAPNSRCVWSGKFSLRQANRPRRARRPEWCARGSVANQYSGLARRANIFRRPGGRCA